MATDLLPSQVVLINSSRLISTPSVHYVFEGEEVPAGLTADKTLFVDLDNDGSVKSYHAASKVNQIYSAQISSNGNERVLQIAGNFVSSGSEENRSSSANPVQEHILKEFDTRNEFLRSLLRDAQTQNLFNLDASSSSDSISSVEDGWRELEDKLNSTANDVESRLSTPEDIHRYLEQSIDDFDLESENTQAIIPESFHDDLDWMSETSNESGHLNLASSTDEALLEADFRALSPELRPTSPFRTSEITNPTSLRRSPSPFAKRALFNLEVSDRSVTSVHALSRKSKALLDQIQERFLTPCLFRLSLKDRIYANCGFDPKGDVIRDEYLSLCIGRCRFARNSIEGILRFKREICGL